MKTQRSQADIQTEIILQNALKRHDEDEFITNRVYNSTAKKPEVLVDKGVVSVLPARIDTLATHVDLFDKPMARPSAFSDSEDSLRHKGGYMTPTKEVFKQLRARNTGNTFKCDEEDWLKARDVQWWEYKGQIMTLHMVTFEDYCQIPGIRRKSGVESLDFRRKNYEMPKPVTAKKPRRSRKKVVEGLQSPAPELTISTSENAVSTL